MPYPIQRPALPVVGQVGMPGTMPVGGQRVDFLDDSIQERIQQPLYHGVTLPIGLLPAETVFFAAVPADTRLGNIQRPNTLPRPQMFECVGIGCQVSINTGVVDVQGITNTGVLQLTVNQKQQLQLPLQWLPGGGGLSADQGGLVGALGISSNGVPSMQNVHTFNIPVILKSEELFDVRIRWENDEAAAHYTTIAATTVWVILYGYLTRKAVGQ